MRKQETQPGAVATTPYRLRISWVLLILLLLLALVAIALPGHARVTGQEDLHGALPRVIHRKLTADSGKTKAQWIPTPARSSWRTLQFRVCVSAV
jgi:hypothetical protein